MAPGGQLLSAYSVYLSQALAASANLSAAIGSDLLNDTASSSLLPGKISSSTLALREALIAQQSTQQAAVSGLSVAAGCNRTADMQYFFVVTNETATESTDRRRKLQADVDTGTWEGYLVASAAASRYLSSTTSSMTLRLASYNADAQSLAFVLFPFEWQAAGVIVGGPPYILALPVLAYSSYASNRWKGIFPDALVLSVMAVFATNVALRVRQITHKHNRHLWRLLYEKTGLLLDVFIVALQASSMLIFVTYASVQASQLGSATPPYNVYDSDNYPQVCPLQACTCDIKAAAHALHFMARFPLLAREASSSTNATNETATEAGGPYRWRLSANLTGMEGFETFLFNTSVLYNLLVVYALVQALVLILMLCSFIQRWSFDPKMGPIARVLWACLPELLHVGAVLLIVALMVAITGAALFGDRAASFSTLSDSMKVLATLLVVGVMDAARADILGSGNLQLTLIETLSQEIYVFILPFILKWVVAALVVGVLVNLFSSLRKQGDHCHSSVVAQIQALLAQCWQCLFQRAPSNQNMLVTMFRLNGRGRSFKAMPSFIRSFVKSALSWKSTMSFGRRSALQRMQSVKLHGVLHTPADIQDAVVTLLRSTKVDTLQSPKLHPGLPSTWTRASALLKPWSRSQSPAAVHPIPTWRPTDSSSDLSGEDEDEQSPHEDLVAAAMYLLQDSTLGPEGGNHVAVLVQQYEQLGSGQAATQQAATDFTSAVWPVAQQTDRPVSGRPRLAPLQMPEGLVLHSTGPEQATAHVTSPDGSTPGASLLTLTKLQPAPSTIPGRSAPLRRGVSVATPRKTVGTLHRHSLDTGAPLPPVQGQRLSPALVRGTSVTIAEIMKQNSRLPPLDHVLPPSPVRKPLPLLRRGSSVATPAGRLTEASSKPGLHSTALKRGSSVASVLTKGSSVAAVSPSSRSINSSPERWPEPVPGWGESPGSPPLTRRSSVTFLSEIRQGVRLSPLSPRRSGSDVPLVRGVSGAVQRSPNRTAHWLQLIKKCKSQQQEPRPGCCGGVQALLPSWLAAVLSG
ncbi:hypothetical protein WJX79_008239 [Trebouxia sp. C0005]